MDFRKIVWKGVDWMHLDPVTDPCEHGNETSGSLKGRKFP